MTHPPDTHIGRAAGLELLSVWTSILFGPLLFLSALSVLYMRVEARCESAPSSLLVGVAVICALATAASGLLGLKEWKRARSAQDSEPEHRVARRKFLAVSGIALSVFSVVLFLGMASPMFVLGACD